MRTSQNRGDYQAAFRPSLNVVQDVKDAPGLKAAAFATYCWEAPGFLGALIERQ
jgi:hypothetical protein